MGGTRSDTGDLAAAGSATRQSLWKPVVLGVLLIAFMVLGRVLNAGDRLGELREWIISLGALGPVAYIVIYITAVIFAVPGSVITIMGGLLFGSLIGVVSVSIGSTIGAGLAFLIARYMARESIAGRLADNSKFQKLDRLTEQHGSIIVAITRLVPLFPFNLLNYGFGLTRVPFRTYLLWSWICMLPGTVLYVVGTDAVASTLAEGKVPLGLIAVLALMLGLITVLVARARRKLKSGEETESDG